MAGTVNRMFQESQKRFGPYAAILRKDEGAYRPMTYSELGEKVRRFSCGLAALGAKKGDDTVAMIAENRPEWAIADLGILHNGSVNVAVFPTLPAEQVRYIVNDSGAMILLASGRQLEKALEVKRTVPGLRIVALDGAAGSGDIMAFEDVLRLGEDNTGDFEGRWQGVGPDDRASIVYTSGTTGEPRGAVLTHRNFTSNVEAAQDALTLKPGDIVLSFLPLNHCLGRMADHYVPLSYGSAIAYVDNVRSLRQTIAEVRPHYMVLVPRVFEMFREGMLARVSGERILRRFVFRWAMSAGKGCCDRAQAGGGIPPLLELRRRIADWMVFRNIRKTLGLDRLKFFVSGSAPISMATAGFFCSMGFSILEGYGLTETSPLVAVNRPGFIRFGTVGFPVKGVEVRIAPDGEILVRGPNVMLGYHNRPRETEEVIGPDGWFHTGDIGAIDEGGYLRIIDRKKSLIVLSNGKKVAPQPVENLLLESPYVSQVMLVGDNESTVSAMIVPAFERVRERLREDGMKGDAGNGELVKAPEVNYLIRSEIQRLSINLAEFERVRQFTLLDHEFSVESGELTPTLKIRRNVVAGRYRDAIVKMYA
jgi:long-chain acyl-CoA synthetase